MGERFDPPAEMSPGRAPAVRPQPPKKDRHIVTWSPEEDERLRQQVSIHGTDNWTSIAAQFENKTSRQCRRRWYTYLNSECKKGGWSAEEDMILCEAQKLFGNRWTEIAKVVSGRTDNAVKNRFSTLCKKRAKLEVLGKENNGPCNSRSIKRVTIQNGCVMATPEELESSAFLKQMRYHISDARERMDTNERLHECQLRPPLSVLVQNFNNVDGVPPTQDYDDISDNQLRGPFLRRNDPKLNALLQQAELLSSLALKVDAENSESLEDAWKELQDYLIQNNILRSKASGMHFLFDDFKDLMEDLRSGNTGQPGRRQADSQEDCRNTSDHRTKSISKVNDQADKSLCQSEEKLPNQGMNVDGVQEYLLSESSSGDQAPAISSSSEDLKENVLASTSSHPEFLSPLQTVPSFQSFAESIPSPKFSASERNFLLSMLGLPSQAQSPNSSIRPSCKRALLKSL